jgi:hypothetical protein
MRFVSFNGGRSGIDLDEVYSYHCDYDKKVISFGIKKQTSIASIDFNVEELNEEDNIKNLHLALKFLIKNFKVKNVEQVR